MQEYRIPTIDEFVAGFEFEVETKHTVGFSVLDFSKNIKEDLEDLGQDTIFIWSEHRVPDYNEKFFTVYQENGTQWTFLTTAFFGDKESYFRKVESLLAKNKIRCKK